MNLIILIPILIPVIVITCADDRRYDRYSGKEIKKEAFLKRGNTNCTINVKPCKPHEGSRVDGTCNNYKYPTRGSARGPYLRLLNPDYAHDKQDIRKDRNGHDLPSARKVRTALQSDGRVVDKHGLTAAAFHFLQFIHLDVSFLSGPLNYLVKRQHCCRPESKLDPRCKPIPVPDDDPYLRVTNIRCMNFTRAETFQDDSCIDKTTKPEQINFQTPIIDLSTIYGVDEQGLNSVRMYKQGLLNLEYRDFRYVALAKSSSNEDDLMEIPLLTPELPGNLTVLNLQSKNNTKLTKKIWIGNVIKSESNTMSKNAAFDNSTTLERDTRQVDVPVALPSSSGINNATLTTAAKVVNTVTPAVIKVGNMMRRNEMVCIQNLNNETRCYVFGFPEAGNFDLRTMSFGIFFMREHNRLAKALHRLNPCWKDDRLFKVARQINIATASNILMYELLPMLLGYENMLKYGLISDHVQHVTAYDEDAVSLVYAEFEVAVRYYHTLLDGRIKLYDEKYHYDGEYSVGNTTFRQSLIEMDKNFDKMNRGTFYQPAAQADDIQDPEISEKYYGDLQRAADLPALDIQQGRDMGVRGYNAYRHICGLKPAKKFEDFADVMDNEKIEALKQLYDEVEDVELLAGIMSERLLSGALAGPTLFCVMTKQLQLFRFADRFWFERGDQFHSLTLPQLHEIRKTNIARFACDNADGIRFIQPRAFQTVEAHNQQVPCTHIPGLDIRVWKDNSCYNDKYYDHDHAHEPEYNQRIFPKKGNYNELHFKNLEEKKGKTMQINKGDKFETEIHWPVHIDSKQKGDKHLTTDQDDGKYDQERHKNDGKYTEDRRLIYEDDGKYDVEIDWPVRKHSKHQNQWAIRDNQWQNRQQNGQPFASVSQNNYQSDSSNFSPFFQSLFGI